MKYQYVNWTFGCCMWLADMSMYYTQNVGLLLCIPQDQIWLLSCGKKDKYCIIPSKYLYQVYYLSKQSVQKHFFSFLEKVYSILK